MTPREHYEEAETLLKIAKDKFLAQKLYEEVAGLLAIAQVHASLAGVPMAQIYPLT